MTFALRPAWPVFALFFLLAAVSYLLHFNGLYGQDAHEYLRQSRVIFDRLHGLTPPPAHLGDSEIAGGYPMLGALIRLTGLNAILAMQVASWLSAAIALWFFEQILRVLSPGIRSGSRWLFGVLGLALAPFFLRAGLTVMSDALGLTLTLAALFFGLRAIEQERHRDVLGFAVFAALTITTRYALVVLLALPALALALELVRTRRVAWLIAGIAAGLLAFLPLWWIKSGASRNPLEHSLIADWSVLNLFRATFSNASGTVSNPLPNLIYLLFPLMHPGFCLTLPALLLLGKRTDIGLYTKRLLALSLLVYLFFLGGLAHQNVRYLLPAYAVLLLLFFPAWDRFYAYGLYFFKKLAHALIGLTLVCQLGFAVWGLYPTIARNRLEQTVARELHATLSPGSVLYGFDLDIALQSYLPDIRFRNLWVQRYDEFEPGSFILFNEPKLREQWAGQNPMINWERASQNYQLLEIQTLPGGWTLYQVLKSK